MKQTIKKILILGGSTSEVTPEMLFELNKYVTNLRVLKPGYCVGCNNNLCVCYTKDK